MVICPDCGKDVKDAKFCSNCGASLNDVAEVVEESVPLEEPADEDVAEVVEVNAVVVSDVAEETAHEDVKEEPAATNGAKKTKFCSNCGKEVDVNTTFCPQCGTRFGGEKVEPQTKFCQSCGEKININAEICPHCGVRVANIRPSEDKSVLLSAILSFLFPGLGHLYIGLNRKAISFIIAYIVSAILVFILIGFVLMLAVWIWAMVDSIKSTEAINNGEYVEDKLF